MPLVLSSVPDLTGGVSQQPVSQRFPNQGENQVNALPLVVGGLIKRPPLNHVTQISASDQSAAFTEFVTRDSTDEGQFVVTFDGKGTCNVNLLTGAARTVILDHQLLGADNYIGDIGGASDSADHLADPNVLRAFTIGDVTFIVNSDITPAMDPASAAPRSAALIANPTDHEALIILRATGPDAKHTIEIKRDGQSTADVFTVTHSGSADDPPSLNDVAEAFIGSSPATGLSVSASQLDDIGNKRSVTQANGVIHLVLTVNFTVTIKDSFGDVATSVVRESTTFFSDLPSTAPHGMIVNVEGSPETSIDDYHCRFTGDGDNVANGDMVQGRWVECPAPGVLTKYDYKTMPHILVKQPTSPPTFVYTTADGIRPKATDSNNAGTYTGISTEDEVPWSTFKFTDRTTGDDTTNPLPSFIGQKINDISFFKNRLVLPNGENVTLSEVGFYFNFFRTTVTQLFDSATIDVGVGGTEISKLDRAVPFSDRLMLFSERAQFSLAGEAVLSPLTVSITKVTDFDVDTGSRPIALGASLFFPFQRGSFSGFQEYFKTAASSTDIQFDANEITAQVPKYISGQVKQIAGSTHENTLVVRSTSGSELFVYKYFNVNRQRTQSAWFKFTFSNVTILNLAFVGTSLFLLTVRNGKTFLERMDLQTGLKDPNVEYVTTIDRRVTYEQSGGSSEVTRNSATEATTTYHITGLQFPTVSAATATGPTQAVTAAGEVLTVASATWDGSKTIVVVNGVIPATTKVFFGEPYTMTYEFAKPLLKRPKEGGGVDIVSTGRHQLRYMTVEYDSTASFSIKVTQLIGDTEGTPITYPFSGRFLSESTTDSIPSETGSFRIPVFLRSEDAKIEIINDSALPSNIQSAEFEAQYTTRIEQLQ